MILGSAMVDLLRQSSETLAGRIAYHDLSPLSIIETGYEKMIHHWVYGGFPDSFWPQLLVYQNHGERISLRHF